MCIEREREGLQKSECTFTHYRAGQGQRSSYFKNTFVYKKTNSTPYTLGNEGKENLSLKEETSSATQALEGRIDKRENRKRGVEDQRRGKRTMGTTTAVIIPMMTAATRGTAPLPTPPSPSPPPPTTG